MLNQLIIKTMPLVPKSIIHMVAKKYIAGDELSDAVRVTQELKASSGAMTTIDVLGEFVDSKERALHEKNESAKVLHSISEYQLDSYLSIKPTSLGFGIDEDFAYENIKYIISKADELGLFVCIDMENSPYTTKTLNLYRRFRAEGLNNIGIVIQAYMRRSEEDILSLKELKPVIRLCKGIYRESSDIAYQEKEEVRNNYKNLLRLI
ncbi:MAG: proline dehydrogenase family protein, partial [Bacteroidota bacterium]